MHDIINTPLMMLLSVVVYGTDLLLLPPAALPLCRCGLSGMFATLFTGMMCALNLSCMQHDASVFRDLNERLVGAVRGDRQFEAALTFPRASDEDRADRIVDFEHLQVKRAEVYMLTLVQCRELYLIRWHTTVWDRRDYEYHTSSTACCLCCDMGIFSVVQYILSKYTDK